VTRVVKLILCAISGPILPLIAMIGYGALAAVPIMMLVRVLKVVEKQRGLPTQNTLRRCCFLLTSRAAKYYVVAQRSTRVLQSDLATCSWGRGGAALRWNERMLASSTLRPWSDRCCAASGAGTSSGPRWPERHDHGRRALLRPAVAICGHRRGSVQTSQTIADLDSMPSLHADPHVPGGYAQAWRGVSEGL
jgi:hypothetical protein